MQNERAGLPRCKVGCSRLAQQINQAFGLILLSQIDQSMLLVSAIAPSPPGVSQLLYVDWAEV